jgi:6-phosphofructokinase
LTGIESRATILGHVRAAVLYSRDRVVASQMANYAVELLEKGLEPRRRHAEKEVVDFDIQELFG